MYNSSYYNPFLYQPYYQGASQLASAGLGRSLGTGLGVKGLLSRFNWSNFLTSTGKTFVNLSLLKYKILANHYKMVIFLSNFPFYYCVRYVRLV